LKQTLAIFLLITLSWQILFKTVYFAYWKINQNYIIENFCVNKDKPKMHCNGKCHLSKQLEKVDETKQDKSKFPTEIFKFKYVDNFIFKDFQISYKNNYYSKNKLKFCFPKSFSLSNGYLKEIYQPPELI